MQFKAKVTKPSELYFKKYWSLWNIRAFSYHKLQRNARRGIAWICIFLNMMEIAQK